MQRTEASSLRFLQAMTDAFRQPDLRRKLLITLGILVVFRFIAHVPVPGVDAERLRGLFTENQLLGVLDLFSGGAMRNLSVAAMGVYPYITASIIMQLMVPVIPKLQELSKEGEQGRQRLNQYTHWATVPLAALQAWGQLVLLSRAGVVTGVGPNTLTLAMVLSMTAGTIFLTWLGELITEHGIGNGISIIIFGGIVANMPQMVGQGLLALVNPMSVLVFLALGLAIVAAIVVFTEAQRRIPVQYGRSVFRGGRMYRQAGTTYLPLRVNSAGMIPLIFAISILLFPSLVASYTAQVNVPWIASLSRFIMALFDPNGGFYWGFYFLLVVAFTFFYTMIIFQQQNLAESLQKNGGFIPGIRPGRPTRDYLTGVLTRITWGGAVFLGLVAISPFFVTGVTKTQALQLSSTAVLIVVGVVLDTLRQLEAQLLMRHYEGFIR